MVSDGLPYHAKDAKYPRKLPPPKGRVMATAEDDQSKPRSDRLLAFFEYEHLPPSLSAVSRRFGDLAIEVVANIAPGPERTVALRKLLEAKDAAVRATVKPGH